MTEDGTVHPRLQAKKICKSFATPVLKDVALEIPAGSIHGLVGENGAGKTTLARIVVGLEKEDSGSLYLDDQPYQPKDAADSQKAGVAFCAQELSLIDDLSVAENILLHTAISSWSRINRRSLDEETTELLDLVGLEHVATQVLVGKLSLAEKQLLEIAKTLATQAKLLVLDEPTSALTEPQVDRLHKILRDRARKGISVIYISHRLRDVLQICEHVSVLRDGQVRLTAESNTLSESMLIQEMAGTDAMLDHTPQAIENQRQLHLTVESLRTSNLPNPISFKCHQGEILGIAGLAGSGRTELLRAIFGIDKRVTGSVKVNVEGKTTETHNPSQSIRCGIGMVAEDRAKDGIFKDQALSFNVTVSGLKQIANLWGRLIPRREAHTVSTLIQALGVRSESSSQKMRELSGGNQQKLMLARWLHCESTLLLLDEPTRGVDVAAKHAIHTELLRLRDSGVTVIVVSSELEELQILCDRILVLSNRNLVADFNRSNWSQKEILAAAFSEYTADQNSLDA